MKPDTDLKHRQRDLAAKCDLRQGVVTDDDPLSVTLGGSDVPYVDVPALESAGTLSPSDTVAVLKARNQILVLGKLA